jgi:hypothetical protein
MEMWPKTAFYPSQLEPILVSAGITMLRCVGGDVPFGEVPSCCHQGIFPYLKVDPKTLVIWKRRIFGNGKFHEPYSGLRIRRNI